MSDVVARQVVVHGRVQGVFFRDSCLRQAVVNDVVGWVANEPDGSVSAHFEGPPASVEKLVAWCHRGPARARVERVEVVVADPTGATRFDVRR